MPANRAPAMYGALTGARKYNVVPSGHQPGAIVHSANAVHVTTKNYYTSPRGGGAFLGGRTPSAASASSLSHRSARSLGSPSPDGSRSRSCSPPAQAPVNLNLGTTSPTANEQHKLHYATPFAAINDPASNYRQLPFLPDEKLDVVARHVVLSRPPTLTMKKRQSAGSKRVSRQVMKKKAYVVPPFKRYQTSYMDALQLPNPRPQGRGMGSLYKTFDPPQSPDPLPGRRRSFKHVQSRVMNHLPPSIELPSDQKIIIRNTRLCYTEKKYTRYQCDHFAIAQQVRKMDTEQRRLMRLQRFREVGDHRGAAAYEEGLRLRRQAREEAYQAIRDASSYLKELDKLPDPMDKERERVNWQIEVAQRRLAIANEMDEIDLRIEMGKREADRFPLPPRPYQSEKNIVAMAQRSKDEEGPQKPSGANIYRQQAVEAEKVRSPEKPSSPYVFRRQSDEADTVIHDRLSYVKSPEKPSSPNIYRQQAAEADKIDERGGSHQQQSPKSEPSIDLQPAIEPTSESVRETEGTQLIVRLSSIISATPTGPNINMRRSVESLSATKESIYQRRKSKSLTADIDDSYLRQLAERKLTEGKSDLTKTSVSSMTAPHRPLSASGSSTNLKPGEMPKDNIYPQRKSKSLSSAKEDNIHQRRKSESLTADIDDRYLRQLAERKLTEGKADLTKTSVSSMTAPHRPLSAYGSSTNLKPGEMPQVSPDNIYPQRKSKSLPSAEKGNIYQQGGAAKRRSYKFQSKSEEQEPKRSASKSGGGKGVKPGKMHGKNEKKGSKGETPVTASSANSSDGSSPSRSGDGSSGHTSKSGYSSIWDSSRSGDGSSGDTSYSGYSSSGGTSRSGDDSSGDTSHSGYSSSGGTSRGGDGSSADTGSYGTDSGSDFSVDKSGSGSDFLSEFEGTSASPSSYEDSGFSNGSSSSYGSYDSFSSSDSSEDSGYE